MLTRLSTTALALSLLAPTAAAQTLIAVEWDGDVYSIDAATGNGTLIGQTGYTNASQQGHNAMAVDGSGVIWVTFSRANGTSELFRIDPNTGMATPSGVQIPIDVRGLAVSPAGTMYAVTNGSPDMLYTIDPATNTAMLVGSTGLSILQSLAWTNNTLYAWDLSVGLVTIDPMTGLATDVNPAQGAGSTPQFLTSDGNGNLLGGRNGLYFIDVTTGVDTLIGTNSAYSDVRGADLVGGGVPYGQGCAGSNGRTPTLGGQGTGIAGSTLSLIVNQGLGNAPFAWGFGAGRGNFPLPGGCSLLINVPPVTATSALDAMGSSTLALTVPAGLSGVMFNAQAVILDPNAPGGGSLSATNGLELTLR